MVDGVVEQVAQDPFDTAAVDLGDHGVVRARCGRRRPCVGERPVAPRPRGGRGPHVDGFGVQFAAPGVEAADLQQVGEQRLEPVELVAAVRWTGRCGGKSSRPSCSTSAAIRTVVSGVRSSWETSEMNRRCTCANSSSCRICAWRFGHPVERPGRGAPGRPRRAPASAPGSRPAASRSATPCAPESAGRTTWRATRKAMAARARDEDPTPRRRVCPTTSGCDCSCVKGKNR